MTVGQRCAAQGGNLLCVRVCVYVALCVKDPATLSLALSSTSVKRPNYTPWCPPGIYSFQRGSYAMRKCHSGCTAKITAVWSWCLRAEHRFSVHELVTKSQRQEETKQRWWKNPDRGTQVRWDEGRLQLRGKKKQKNNALNRTEKLLRCSS